VSFVCDGKVKPSLRCSDGSAFSEGTLGRLWPSSLQIEPIAVMGTPVARAPQCVARMHGRGLLLPRGKAPAMPFGDDCSRSLTPVRQAIRILAFH